MFSKKKDFSKTFRKKNVYKPVKYYLSKKENLVNKIENENYKLNYFLLKDRLFVSFFKKKIIKFF